MHSPSGWSSSRPRSYKGQAIHREFRTTWCSCSKKRQDMAQSVTFDMIEIRYFTVLSKRAWLFFNEKSRIVYICFKCPEYESSWILIAARLSYSTAFDPSTTRITNRPHIKAVPLRCGVSAKKAKTPETMRRCKNIPSCSCSLNPQQWIVHQKTASSAVHKHVTRDLSNRVIADDHNDNVYSSLQPLETRVATVLGEIKSRTFKHLHDLFLQNYSTAISSTWNDFTTSSQ